MLLKRLCTWMVIALVAPLALAEEDYIPDATLSVAKLVKTWQLRLPLEADQRLVDLYLVDDQVYATTNDGFVFAIHAPTGANRWLRRAAQEGYRIRRPCHVGERAVFVSPTTILQVDRRYGDGISKTELRFAAGTGAITDGVRLIIGGLDRRVYAIDAANPLYSWKSITNAPITSTPALYNGSLFVASSDGTVYSCTAEKKAFRWQTSTYSSITADLVADEGGVYVASRDNSLYLYDLLFGEIRWRARFSGPLYEAPVLAGDRAYQFCPDDGLVAVNTSVIGIDERFQWKLPRGRTLLTIDEKYAYILSQDETVLVVGLEDGQIVHTIAVAGFTITAPDSAETVLYLANPDGRIFCARPVGAPIVQRSDLRAALNPPAEEAESAAAGADTAAAPEEKTPDLLQTSRRGAPLGGKSKVSKEFGKSGGARP
ncbi:MAG: PQQ-binding-like beta-propeller repeat protein [Planctomycetota bacterium]